MTPEVEAALRRWRALADKGYHGARHPARMARIEQRIRWAKERYEKLLNDSQRRTK